MLEIDIEQRVCDLAWERLGIVGSKLVTPGETGYPDRIFWLPGGRPFLIEFKRVGEQPRPKQTHTHKQLKKLGYQIEVHDDAIEAFAAIVDAVASLRLPQKSRQILARARRFVALARSGIRENI